MKDLILGNIAGFFGFVAGFFISLSRLFRKTTRPNVVFLKGGFVSLPVGLAAGLLKIPYIIHESDATPGLANRLLMKKASKVAFGMPPSEEILKSHSNYVWTGIPVAPSFKPISSAKQAQLKQAFSFSKNKPLVVITGGSQGAENINEAVRTILPDLLKFTSVALIAGRRHYENMLDLKKYENWEGASLESNFRMWEFNTTMDELLGAADVVVSRAGATTIAELAGLRKAVILIPFERLPGAHQVKNAERLAATNSALVINDLDMFEHPDKLLESIRHLVHSPKERERLAQNLSRETRSHAARTLAELILSEA